MTCQALNLRALRRDFFFLLFEFPLFFAEGLFLKPTFLQLLILTEVFEISLQLLKYSGQPDYNTLITPSKACCYLAWSLAPALTAVVARFLCLCPFL